MKKGYNIRWSILALSILIALVSFSWYVEAQQSLSSSIGVIVYPSKGQTAQQQSQAEGECYSWAKQQTGIDPVAAASAPTQTQGSTAGKGERVKGAAKGAAAGAAVGAIAGEDAGKAAGAGAAVGTVAGGREKRKAKKEQEQQAQQAKATNVQQFNKAFGACMQGKGYTVK